MAKSADASQGASWNPRTDASTPARRGFPRWRLERSRGGKRRSFFKTILAGLLYLLLAGLLIWVVLWLSPPQPARLVLIGAGYETNLAIPQNVYGRELLKDLEELTRRSPLSLFWRSKRLVLAHPARTLRTKLPWDKDLTSFPEKTVVICMAVHGGSDAKGAYLLPDDADTQDLEPNRLRLAEVLDRLADKPLEKKHKVLILDATRLPAYWPLGLLKNDFARELEAANDKIKSIPGLVVISSSANDERSCDSIQWRRTAFGHYLVEGLKGGAARPDGRIDVRSLYHYVREQVGLWAGAARGTAQTPVLYPREGGLDRAAEMELAAIPLRSSTTEAKPVRFTPSADLLASWRDYDRLASQDPPPAAYAPHTWSLYQATLLRLEELEIAGDQGSAKSLLVRLGELERELNESVTIPLARSRTSSLTMSAVSGLRLPPAPDAVEQQFNLLWSAPPEEFPKRWGQMLQSLAADSPGQRTTVRLQVIGKILDRATDSPSQDLARAVALLKAVDSAAEPRPAEAHDLIMLSRPGDSPGKPNDTYFQAVSKAIRARLLAEQAALGLGPAGHPYCERVVPWIPAMVEPGDVKRRLGQDLLFATDESRWSEASRLLDEARTQYSEALETAGTVRKALALRDRVLPVLTSYAQWVALGHSRDRALRQKVESLFDSLHLLDGQIAPPQRGAKTSPARDLDRRAEQISSAFQELQRAFAKDCEAVLGSEEPETVQSLEDALRIPFLDLPEIVKQDCSRLTQLDITQPANYPRVKLWTHLGKVDERLQDRHLQLIAGAGDQKAAPVTAEERQARINEAARSQVRLAATTLGRSWYSDSLPPDAESFDQVRDRAATLDVERDRLWLARLGDHLAARWVGMTDEIVKQVQKPQPQSQQKDDYAGLRRADALTHLLDPPSADLLARHLLASHHPRALKTSINRTQLTAYRRVLVRSVLLNQARRAFEDHWFGEGTGDGDKEPYYRTSALAYLDDAQTVDPLQFAPAAEVNELVEKVTRSPDGVRIEGLDQRVVTDEPMIDLRSTVQSETSGRRGYPVFWTDPVEAFRVMAPAQAGRMVVELGAQASPKLDWHLEYRPQEAPAPFDLVPSERALAFTVHGLFRGQRFQHATRLALFPRAEQVAVHHPLTGLPRVAVRADAELFNKYGSGTGVIAFVIDASGSMGAPRGEAFTEQTRYAIATRALEQVLSDLPAGTIVGLYSFGSAPPSRKDVPAEETIKTVQPLSRWEPSMLSDWMGRIRYPSIEPWSESPIVRTILSARDDLMSLNAPGLKSIIVITDGDDNRFTEDRVLNPQAKDVPTALKEAFRDTEIQLNVIGFRPTSVAEMERMNSQYQVITQLPVPGRFYYADDVAQIVANIRSTLRRELSYRILGEDERPLPEISARSVQISRPDANFRWFPLPLQPGGYKLTLQADQRISRQPASLVLNLGDLLLVNLTGADGSLRFDRALYAKEFRPFSPSAFDSRSRWRLTLLQHEKSTAGSIQLLAAMERLRDPKETTLRLIRPREIWFDLTAGGEDGKPLPLRWTEREGYPAPTWAINVTDWPGDGKAENSIRPMLRAWWREDFEAPPVRTLQSPQDFEPGSIVAAPRPIAVAKSTVTIDGVTIEEQTVEVGDRARERRPCLVVRLSYKDRPYWVRPAGVNFVGSEHRCYLSAKRYTGIYWTKTRDEVQGALRQLRLELMARDDFQAACRSDGTVIELLLDPPKPDESRPLPIESVPVQLPP